jgi:HEAT repeat protein
MIRGGFRRALERIRQRGKGWLAENNLSRLSHASPEEVGLFLEVWRELPDEMRLEVAESLRDLVEEKEEGLLSFDEIWLALLDDPLAQVREAAALCLRESVDPRVLRRLLEVFQDDEDAGVRSAAALSLGESLSTFDPDGPKGELVRRYARALAEAFRNELESPLVRACALRAYALCEGEDLEELIQEAYDSEHEDIRRAAVFAMGATNDESWLGLVHRELHSEDPEMRLAAVSAVGAIRGEASFPLLRDLIATDPDEEVRQAAVMAIGAYDNTPEAMRLLEELTESADVAVAEAAEEMLEYLQWEREMEDLLMFDFGAEEPSPLDDEDEED